jgi:hypothetical protein
MAWISAIGALVGARSQYLQGKEAKSAAEYNAQLSEQESASASNQSLRDEEAQRRAARMQKGRAVTALAESGGGSGGSNGLLLDQSDAAAELDALNIRYGGLMRSSALRNQATLTRLSGRNAESQSGLLAGASLLRGASDTYRNYRLVNG